MQAQNSSARRERGRTRVETVSKATVLTHSLFLISIKWQLKASRTAQQRGIQTVSDWWMNQHVTFRSKRKPWWTDVNRATSRPPETSRARRNYAFVFSAWVSNVATNFSLKCQCYGQASPWAFCRRSSSGPFSLFLLWPLSRRSVLALLSASLTLKSLSTLIHSVLTREIIKPRWSSTCKRAFCSWTPNKMLRYGDKILPLSLLPGRKEKFIKRV